MPDHRPTDDKALRQMRVNFQKLYGINSGESNNKNQKSIQKRCSYVRQNLSPDGLIRWAQTTTPKSFSRGKWHDFTNSVRKIHKQKSRWSSEVVEYLGELSETEFSHSEEFQALYKGKT
jgi:hypothetical protein